MSMKITDVTLQTTAYPDGAPAIVLEFKIDGVAQQIPALWPDTQGLGIYESGSAEMFSAILRSMAKAIDRYVEKHATQVTA